MNGTIFVRLTIFILLVLLFIYRKKIKTFVGNNDYLYCWAIMLVSNLGFPSSIQYLTRALGMAITWLFLLIKNGGKFKVNAKSEPFVLFMLYLAICFLSCSYSISKLQSFVKVVEMFTDIVLLTQIMIQNKKEPISRKIFDLTVVVCFALLSISLIGFFVYPSYFANTGIQASRSLLGIRLGAGLLGSNKASALAAFGIVWLLLLNYRKSFWTYLMSTVCILVMFFSQSRASLALLPVIIFFKLFRPKDKLKYLYIAIMPIIGVLVYKNADLIYRYLLRGQTTEMLMSGTGRATMWEYARYYIEKRPLTGYGFGAGGELATSNFYGVATVHNGIFETLLGTGAIGLIVLLLQVLYVAKVIIYNLVNFGLRNNVSDIIIVFYFTIRTITSLGIANWHSPELMIWIMFMFVIKKGRSLQMLYSYANHDYKKALSESLVTK